MKRLPALALVTLTGKWLFYSRSYFFSLQNKQSRGSVAKRLSNIDRHLFAPTQQMFAFIGVLCGALSAAQRGKRRKKTVELCCFGVRTHICHRKSHFMGGSAAHARALPRPPAPSHRPLQVCIFKNGRRRRNQRQTFYPPLSCLNCSEKQTFLWRISQPTPYNNIFYGCLAQRLLLSCRQDRRPKKNFYWIMYDFLIVCFFFSFQLCEKLFSRLLKFGAFRYSHGVTTYL